MKRPVAASLGAFHSPTPPTSTIQDVWQTSLQFNKCVTAEEESRKKMPNREENYVLEHYPHSD